MDGDVEADAEQTFQAGLDDAQLAWLEALEPGMRDPVVYLRRIGSEESTRIEVGYQEREAAVEWLAGYSPGAAACLQHPNTPGMPMTVLVEFGGIISIMEVADPRFFRGQLRPRRGPSAGGGGAGM
jgi:hypothetical protein